MDRSDGGAQCSILYADVHALTAIDDAREPAYFADLNLDQLVAAVTRGRSGYHLNQFFYTPLHTVEAVEYRHAVLADLQQPAVAACVSRFAQAMRGVRGQQEHAAERRYRVQQQRALLDATAGYCAAVQDFSATLAELPLHSDGMTRFRDYLERYLRSDAFRAMESDARAIRQQLDGIRYTVTIKNSTVTVDDYHDEDDYSAQVLATFDRFKQGAARSHLVEFSDPVDMNHVETQIADRVALLHPEVFAALRRHADAYGDCVDPTIATVERESQFYQAYSEFASALGKAGLPFSVPAISDTTKEVRAVETFDIALAGTLVPEKSAVVCNDITLSADERIIVVSGPNQGGKTTFSRTFGQLHHLGSLGLPVPGRQTRLFLPDRIFTHYERAEDLSMHRGKLEDELVRIREILRQATPRSVVIINEIFTSTTLEDAIVLGTAVMRRVIALDALCVCVTFVDELAELSDSTVSMVSTVVEDNPAERTFKVVRRPADGLAYAAAIAQKYGLSYRSLTERVAS